MSVTEQSISAHTYIIDRAEISSPFFPDKRFDIRLLILDLDIFESINKPYMTGLMTVIDDNSLYSGINFRGVESFRLTVRLPDAGFTPITKIFYIDKVVTNQRANDQQAVLMLHLTEDIGFTSEYINLNLTYQGKGSKIITDIFKQNFDKDVEVDALVTEDVQPVLKIVAPNITPIELADWIKDRMTSSNGSPFYLFSSLGSDKLFLRNFQTMIFNPVNTGVPFRYSQALVNKNELTLDEEMFIIENHHDNETADITSLNESGFVNAKYAFHDIVFNRVYTPGNASKTQSSGTQASSGYGKRWTAFGLFDNKFFEGRPEVTPFQRLANPYPTNARLPWKLSTDPATQNSQDNPLMHERPESRAIAQVFASYQFNDAQGYLEGRTENDHKLKIDSKAIRNWIVTDPLTFTVPGRLFLTGEVNATIGYKYRLEFTTSIGENIFSDARRSGDYLIYTARHSFTRDHGYRVHLTGVGIETRGLSSMDQIETPDQPIYGPQ